MDFFSFCICTDRTKQILGFGFGHWDSEETLIHIVKNMLANGFAGIFNMKKSRRGEDKDQMGACFC